MDQTSQSGVTGYNNHKPNKHGYQQNLGMLLLAVYLIVVGLIGLLGIGGLAVVASILAVAAGVLLLLGK